MVTGDQSVVKAVVREPRVRVDAGVGEAGVHAAAKLEQYDG